MTEQAQERFKTLLGRYSEENYFYLARNYLGLIKTPFHKPQLTAKLCNFFSQKEIQKQMIDLLDEFDLVILSLLELSGPMKGEQITELLRIQYSYGNLMRRVSNLQERLILLNDGGLLVFNPLIEKELSSLCTLKPLLGTYGGQLYDTPFCDTEFLRAYLALLGEEHKRTFSESYAARFPAYEVQRLHLIFVALTEILSSLGILQGDKKVEIVHHKAAQLLELDTHQLLCFLLAATLDSDFHDNALPFCSELITILQTIKSCDTASLKLLIRVLASKYQLPYYPNLLTTLSTFAIITLDEVWHVSNLENTKPRSSLLVDSDQSISYTGSCDSHDILYRFTVLDVLDQQKRYVVTKESIIAAFDSGLGLAEIDQYLRANTSNGMSDALLRQIALLEQRYESMSIYDGIVLCGDQRMANLVLHLPSLSEHMIKQLSPTIFLMRRETEAQWRDALQSTGQLVGATKRYDHIEVLPKQSFQRFQSLFHEATHCNRRTTIQEVGTVKIARFNPAIKKAIEDFNLTVEQRQDHEHRYLGKLIVHTSQIAEQVINTAIEAGGFDYQGKVSLCKQAVGKKNIALQLQLTDQELVVQALELAFTPQKEALLKVAVMPQMEVKILPVSKIFLVRLVRYHLS